MKRKITINCKDKGFWEVADFGDYYEDIKVTEGEEKAETFFSIGTFKGNEIEQESVTHFIDGYLEGLMQRDSCPAFLYEEDIESITVEAVKENPTLVKCKDCRHCGFDMRSFTDIRYKCEKEVRDLSEEKSLKNLEVSCEQYKHKFIQYPMTINGIEKPKDRGIRDYYRAKAGTLVKIRPCAKEYEDKTFLGLLLGEIDTGLMISHSEESGKLSIYRHYNPAIFVPELQKIVYGMESWWGVIQSEDEIKDITNEDIDQTWYVQLLKQHQQQETTDEPV